MTRSKDKDRTPPAVTPEPPAVEPRGPLPPAEPPAAGPPFGPPDAGPPDPEPKLPPAGGEPPEPGDPEPPPRVVEPPELAAPPRKTPAAAMTGGKPNTTPESPVVRLRAPTLNPPAPPPEPKAGEPRLGLRVAEPPPSRRYSVGVPHGGRLVVAAADRDGAIREFCAKAGVLGTDHQFDVIPLDEPLPGEA